MYIGIFQMIEQQAYEIWVCWSSNEKLNNLYEIISSNFIIVITKKKITEPLYYVETWKRA